MPSERDPRVGMVYQKRGKRRYIVGILTHEGRISRVVCGRVTHKNGELDILLCPTLTQFRRWAKDAEVIHAAD
jgi:hypothetical protein